MFTKNIRENEPGTRSNVGPWVVDFALHGKEASVIHAFFYNIIACKNSWNIKVQNRLHLRIIKEYCKAQASSRLRYLPIWVFFGKQNKSELHLSGLGVIMLCSDYGNLRKKVSRPICSQGRKID